MKNLPGYILLASLAGTVLLTVASCLGFDFPYLPLTARIVGLSCAAGVVAIFLGDYAPQPAAPADRAEATQPVKRPVPHAANRRRVAGSAAASLGLHRNPATVSL